MLLITVVLKFVIRKLGWKTMHLERVDYYFGIFSHQALGEWCTTPYEALY